MQHFSKWVAKEANLTAGADIDVMNDETL